MGFWQTKQGGQKYNINNINRRNFVMVNNLIVNIVSVRAQIVLD